MDEGTNISKKERASLVPGATPPEPGAPGPDFAAAVQPSYMRTVFFGPDGLKAGWGLGFYVAMFYPLQFVVGRWAWSRNLGADGLLSLIHI